MRHVRRHFEKRAYAPFLSLRINIGQEVPVQALRWEPMLNPVLPIQVPDSVSTTAVLELPLPPNRTGLSTFTEI
jgi:hypothetical protein